MLSACGGEDPWPDQRYQATVHLRNLYIGKGDCAKAVDAYLRALKIFPDWPDTYFTLVWAPYHFQHWRETIDWIEVARSRSAPVTPLFRND